MAPGTSSMESAIPELARNSFLLMMVQMCELKRYLKLRIFRNGICDKISITH